MNEQTPIHAVYLPFSEAAVREHFTGDKERQAAYFRRSAENYMRFLTSGVTERSVSPRVALQIEKDERFWTASALMALVNHPPEVLVAVLTAAFGPTPPLRGFETWEQCVEGGVELILEAALPSPKAYGEWLRANISARHVIPHVLSGASERGARTLEGATHVDGVFVSKATGFALFIEAKVLSDISYGVTFDAFRNQLVRNLDVLIEPTTVPDAIAQRDPDATLFALLTPECFRRHWQSRLYGWLFREYTTNPNAICRDLPHRPGLEASYLAQRMGWLTYEGINAAAPGACPWLATQSASEPGV
jgi:hypothetical protein